MVPICLFLAPQTRTKKKEHHDWYYLYVPVQRYKYYLDTAREKSYSTLWNRIYKLPQACSVGYWYFCRVLGELPNAL